MIKMSSLRSIISGSCRARTALTSIQAPVTIQKFRTHMQGPPQPFDNLPFSVPNRYAATVFFSVFFGVGLWAPFIIVWYMMAKRTL